MAILWRPPAPFGGGGFGKSMEEIADLTDAQIAFLVAAAAGPKTTLEDGSEVRGGLSRVTKQHFFETWRSCGKPDAWIQAEWDRDYSANYSGPPYDPTGKAAG